MQAEIYNLVKFPSTSDLDHEIVRRMRHLTAKLLVEPEHRVLMLGGTENRLAQYITRVTGATVDAAVNIQNAGGPYDRLIAVGMFEGDREYKAFFKRAFTTVKRVGVILLQGIGQHQPSPAGYPAISQILPKVEATNFLIKDLEIVPGDQAGFFTDCNSRTGNPILKAYLENNAEAFRSQDRFLYELQLSAFQDSVPFTRDYISQREEVLEKKEKETGIIS